MRTLLCFFVLGCSHQVLGEGVRSGRDVVRLAVEEGCHDAESDRVLVVGAELGRRELRLRLRHGGGCGEHSYRLCPDPVTLRIEPAVQRLVVVHDAGGDRCEAEIEVNAEVALEDLPHAILSLGSLDENTLNVSIE